MSPIWNALFRIFKDTHTHTLPSYYLARATGEAVQFLELADREAIGRGASIRLSYGPSGFSYSWGGNNVEPFTFKPITYIVFTLHCGAIEYESIM